MGIDDKSNTIDVGSVSDKHVLKVVRLLGAYWCGMVVLADRAFQSLFNHVVAGIMVFNATFNNISDISRRSVLLVEETGVLWENHRPVASH